MFIYFSRGNKVYKIYTYRVHGALITDKTMQYLILLLAILAEITNVNGYEIVARIYDKLKQMKRDKLSLLA